jgi:hypothetical protein
MPTNTHNNRPYYQHVIVHNETQRWENHVLTYELSNNDDGIDETLMILLNDLGQVGWEQTGMINNNGYIIITFKRLIP